MVLHDERNVMQPQPQLNGWCWLGCLGRHCSGGLAAQPDRRMLLQLLPGSKARSIVECKFAGLHSCNLRRAVAGEWLDSQ